MPPATQQSNARHVSFVPGVFSGQPVAAPGMIRPDWV